MLPPLGESRVLATAGVAIRTGKFRIDLAYTGAFASRANSHGVKATASIAF